MIQYIFTSVYIALILSECPGRSWKWLKVTFISQLMTQQGRMATPAKVCFSFQQCLTLPLGLKCFYPSTNSSSISFWDLSPSFYSLVFYFWCCSSEGRDVPSNFSVAHYNLLSWGNFWCMTCHPSQLGLLQHAVFMWSPHHNPWLRSFVPFSCHLCTLLIFTVGWGS